jgi:hypothetical protein
MKKHGIQLNYGNIHTKAIKHSLKHEKLHRQKENPHPVHISHMMEGFAIQSSLLLVPEDHLAPNDSDQASVSSFKSIDNEQFETKSKSTFHKMKDKFKKTLNRKKKGSDNRYLHANDGEQIATSSDAASQASQNSAGDEIQKSNQSLDKV